VAARPAARYTFRQFRLGKMSLWRLQLTVHSTRTLRTWLAGLLRLSRWKEHTLFTIPLTLLGALMAAENRPGVTLDWRLLTVTVANVLAMTVAFMVNDVEDAPDDARDPARAARNPIATGEVRRAEGWGAALALAAIALALYAWVGGPALWIGALTLALSVLYSWRAVRLKARPIVDVLSHVLMLSALLFLAGYFTYDRAPGQIWLVALGAALASGYGQLYNQLRDYDVDQAAGLRNTAWLVGAANTRRLMYTSLALAAACLLASVVLGLWPLWLLLVPLLLAPLLVMFRPQTDARGTQAIDASGRVQMAFLVVANAAVLAWLAAVVLR